MLKFDRNKLIIFAKNKIHHFDNKKLVLMFSILSFLILSILSSLFYIRNQKPPAISDLATIEFYSEDNVKFFELNNDKSHTYITLKDIAPNMIKAIISIEDQHFYDHSGFDYLRIIKAVIDNVIAMSKRYGASTITQQYARNLYLNHEKSYERKIKEAYYTMLLENNYSKDEILEGYLNTIYFGHGVYGIADASQFYFNKNAKDLSIAQSAVLASIPKAPTYYSPLNNFERNNNRKELILNQMFIQEKITEIEYKNALIEPISISGTHPQSQHNIAPFYQDIIVYELEKFNLVLDDFYKGIKVYTTLDIRLNEIIERSIDEIYSPNSNIETAIYAIDPNNGHVKAVIGGRDYKNSQYNRALAGMRHPGSTIKPMLYYSALEYGFTA
ncbi:MAG: pbpG, partial [Haloplasmataceae bacterium]|nr:pbpG [Haloplasmataceae bacterium]